MDDQQQDQQLTDMPVQDQPTQTVSAGTGDLDAVKKQAVEALAPLIKNLHNVEPARKFEITMNVMRLTNNRELAQSALDAALAIQEEDTKTEALVELIAEIDFQLKA
jgi:tellurite resistance protein